MCSSSSRSSSIHDDVTPLYIPSDSNLSFGQLCSSGFPLLWINLKQQTGNQWWGFFFFFQKKPSKVKVDTVQGMKLRSVLAISQQQDGVTESVSCSLFNTKPSDPIERRQTQHWAFRANHMQRDINKIIRMEPGQLQHGTWVGGVPEPIPHSSVDRRSPIGPVQTSLHSHPLIQLTERLTRIPTVLTDMCNTLFSSLRAI